jgi:hypothetical protein
MSLIAVSYTDCDMRDVALFLTAFHRPRSPRRPNGFILRDEIDDLVSTPSGRADKMSAQRIQPLFG